MQQTLYLGPADLVTPERLVHIMDYMAKNGAEKLAFRHQYRHEFGPDDDADRVRIAQNGDTAVITLYSD